MSVWITNDSNKKVYQVRYRILQNDPFSSKTIRLSPEESKAMQIMNKILFGDNNYFILARNLEYKEFIEIGGDYYVMGDGLVDIEIDTLLKNRIMAQGNYVNKTNDWIEYMKNIAAPKQINPLILNYTVEIKTDLLTIIQFGDVSFLSGLVLFFNLFKIDPKKIIGDVYDGLLKMKSRPFIDF